MSPSSTWTWKNSNGSLSLEMAESQHCAMQFPAKCLRLFNREERFTLDQTHTYYSFIELLDASPISLTDAQRFHIALHATAAKHFHKPVTIKSWWFDDGEDMACVDDICMLQSQSHSGLVLMLDRDDATSLVMFISSGFITNTQKELPAFSVVKVCNSKLTSAAFDTPQQKRA